jgi:opacity protein-like surface antigen
MKSKTLLTAAFVSLLCAGVTHAGAQSTHSARGHVGEDNVLRIQLSSLTPEGDRDYWHDKQLDFTGTPSDLEDVGVTFDYQRRITARLALMTSLSAYEGNADQSYLRYTDSFGNDITHTTRLERSDLTLGLVFFPFGRDAVLVPYVGAGLGVYGWRLQESGDFIDFTATPARVIRDRFTADGNAFGHYWLAGLEVPLGWNWAVFAEGRWDRADDQLNKDFTGFGTLDLSSKQVGVGISWSF